MAWVGKEVLPHEGDVRTWLRRTFDPADLEDIIQEAYCKISGLEAVEHIGSGRAYLFTTARSIVLTRLRRDRIVRIETVADMDILDVEIDSLSPERIAGGRRELARVLGLIDALPERCRQVFRLRKIEGLSQRDVAAAMGVSERTVENDVVKGLKLILKAVAEGQSPGGRDKSGMEQDGRSRDSRRD